MFSSQWGWYGKVICCHQNGHLELGNNIHAHPSGSINNFSGHISHAKGVRRAEVSESQKTPIKDLGSHGGTTAQTT